MIIHQKQAAIGTALAILAGFPCQTHAQKPQKELVARLHSPTLAAITGKPDNLPLTINECMRIGLSLSRPLEQAAEAAVRASAHTGEAKSALNPTIGTAPGDVYLHDAARLSLGIQGTLPIDISGAIRSAVDRSRFEEIAARLALQRVRNQVILDIQTAFYDALRARALVEVADSNLKTAAERLHDAREKYRAQAVAYFDVVRAETDYANSQKLSIDARSSSALATARLAATLGIQVQTPLNLSDENAIQLPTAAFTAGTKGAVQGGAVPDDAASISAFLQQADTAVQPGAELSAALIKAMKARPELMEADADIAAAQKGVAYARRSQLPTLSVSAGYFNIRSSTGTAINEPEALLNLNVPISDGGTARARVQQARMDVESAKTARRQTEDVISLQVQQAWLNEVQARQQVSVSEQAAIQARTAYGIARVRYNAGVSARAGISPGLEMSDAQSALTLAEQNRVNALYDFNRALALMRWAIADEVMAAGNKK